MITAQEIREKGFSKSKIGGYEMSEVDDFLESIADDLTNSQKELAVVNSKCKVLAQKIEEYRSNESALNQAVLSAQKLAIQIESEAKEKADKMIAEAQAKVDELLGDLPARQAAEEKRLHDAEEASEKFIEGIRSMCNAQLKNIDRIWASNSKHEIPVEPAAPVEAPQVKAPVKDVEPAEVPAEKPLKASPAVDIEEAIRSIEASVSKKASEPSIHMDLSADMNARSGGINTDSTQPFTF